MAKTNLQSFNIEEVKHLFKEYFDIDEDTVVKALQNEPFTCEKNRLRLQAMLGAVTPFCEPFKEITSLDRKHKVGEKFLSKLKYDSFLEVESIETTSARLYDVYEFTSKKGINTYKIIGSTMLSDANLYKKVEKKDDHYVVTDYSYGYDERKVDCIYAAIKGLGFSDAECIQLFEKNKTLFSKGYAMVICDVFDNLKKLGKIWSDSNVSYGFGLFKNEEEIRNVLLQNSSLLINGKSICKNFNYMAEKMGKDIDLMFKNANVSQTKNDNFASRTIQILRGLIIDSGKSGLLTAPKDKIDEFIDSVPCTVVLGKEDDIDDEERDNLTDEDDYLINGNGDWKKFDQANGYYDETEERYKN